MTRKGVSFIKIDQRLARAKTYGAEDGGGTPEKFAEFIRSEMALWARVVKDGNVKVDS